MDSTQEKVAVVTGSNKGIGFAIVKGLCEKWNGKVYLTARSEELGKEAVQKLKKDGLNAVFHQLDLNNHQSVDTFKEDIEKTDGGIDILINNAGMAFGNAAPEPPGVQAEKTIATNYFGTLRVCEALFPLLRPNAQVVHVSSSMGHLSKIPSAEIRAKFSDPTLTVEELNKMMHQFVEDAKNNKHIENGWGKSMYAVSKVGVSVLSMIQQRQFNQDQGERNIFVNFIHPGYVATDMTSHKGPLNVEEGARAALYLALESHAHKGQFVCVTTLNVQMDSKNEKVAVVTGGNKGIGFAIVKGLCDKFKGKVYLTARSEKLGNEAVEKLKQQGLNAIFHQLDINDSDSINKFKQHIEDTVGGIDVLINNAGIAFKQAAVEPAGVQAEVTVATNYFGTLHLCEALFPVLRPNAQVINVSSSCGHLSQIPSSEMRAKFSNPNLTVDELNKLMHQFVEDAKNNKHIENGWGNSTYVVSKVGLSALTIIQQREFDKDPEKRNISANSVHPGYVATDMSSYKGPLTIEEGARAPLYLALEDHKLKGGYMWYDTKVVDWYAPTTPAESY
ncbi:hypothetical protein FQR65_LT06758 [Abscondita terminalis]|nr:hypothetical protein FQR65_LT06758 [Abscondita terminalis]